MATDSQAEPGTRQRLSWFAPQASPGLQMLDIEDRLQVENELRSLRTQFHALDRTAFGPGETAIAGRFAELIAKLLPDGDQPERLEWNEACEAEELLARLLPEAALRAKWPVVMTELAQTDAAQHAGLEAEWSKLTGVFDVARARSLLAAAQSELRKAQFDRFFLRRLGTLYAGRLFNVVIVSSVIAIVAVIAPLAARGWLTLGWGFAGVFLALAAGLLGAGFSMLTGRSAVFEARRLDELRFATGLPVLILRLGVGVTGAVGLYFLLDAGLIDGALFPNLQHIGFASNTTPPDADLAAALQSATAGISGAKDAVAQAGAALNGGGLDALKSAGTQLENAVGRLEDIKARSFGSFVPNADLSKLFVWSFLAGFSEKLVPSLLTKAASKGEAQ